MKRFSLSVIALTLMILAGCATAPPEKEPLVFFPSPPDPPRIQFLKSMEGAADIEPPKSAFYNWITGGKKRSPRLNKPYGLAVYGGKIYVCDTNATVFVFDLEKKTYSPLKGAQGLGALAQPQNIAIDKDGNKFVADPSRKQVVMFDKNDFYVKAFGPVENWRPVDVAPYGELLYVVDSKNADIKVFDISSGALRNTISKKSDGSKIFALPTNIVFDREGYMYISDFGQFKILKIDRDGNVRSETGDIGRGPGSFARPRGLDFDKEDRLYVVDAAFGNVQLFGKNGQLLLFFGKGGIGPGDLYLPAKVYINYDSVKYFQQYADPNFQIQYLIFVTSQFGIRPVNIYAFGTEKGQVYKTDEELQKELKERMEKERKEQAEKEQKEQAEKAQKEKAEKAQVEKDQKGKPADSGAKTGTEKTSPETTSPETKPKSSIY